MAFLQEHQPKPPMDLFKAIFADSSSDSEQSSAESESEIGEQQLQYVDGKGKRESKQVVLALKRKHWQDLSVVTSHREQPQEMHGRDPLICNPPETTVGNGLKNLKETNDKVKTHDQHGTRGESAQPSGVHKTFLQILSYGPALPPGKFVYAEYYTNRLLADL